uniref:Mediator complex subunit 27 n=1 Tax=Rhabditophanes sp. KR3021 TaxID=114890 RepID=A0AC35TWU4_9BILA
MHRSNNPHSSPYNDAVNENKRLMNSLSDCLQKIRTIKANVLLTQKMIANGCTDVLQLDKYVDRIKETSIEVNKGYDELENHAKKLPSLTSNSHIDKLSRLMLDATADADTAKVVDDLCKNQNWMTIQSNYLNYLHEFMKTTVPGMGQKTLVSAFTAKPVPRSGFLSAQTPHSIFETTFLKYVVGVEMKNTVQCTYPEKGFQSCVIEIKFGGYQDLHHRYFIATQKVLFIVNNGIIDYCIVADADEDWEYIDAHRGKFNYMFNSRRLVFRKLSENGNEWLGKIQAYFSGPNSNVYNYIKTIFTIFSKYQKVFDTQCGACKKIMKDHMPPTNFDIVSKLFFHSNCR